MMHLMQDLAISVAGDFNYRSEELLKEDDIKMSLGKKTTLKFILIIGDCRF